MRMNLGQPNPSSHFHYMNSELVNLGFFANYINTYGASNHNKPCFQLFSHLAIIVAAVLCMITISKEKELIDGLLWCPFNRSAIDNGVLVIYNPKKNKIIQNSTKKFLKISKYINIIFVCQSKEGRDLQDTRGTSTTPFHSWGGCGSQHQWSMAQYRWIPEGMFSASSPSGYQCTGAMHIF